MREKSIRRYFWVSQFVEIVGVVNVIKGLALASKMKWFIAAGSETVKALVLLYLCMGVFSIVLGEAACIAASLVEKKREEHIEEYRKRFEQILQERNAEKDLEEGRKDAEN